MEGTESTGLGFTVIIAVSDAEQPPLVPVTVYVVVEVGLAFTLEPVLALSPDDGDHV